VVSSDALAAVIAAVATDGFALVDEELETGVRSLAVPIRDRSGRIVAALNIGAQVGRVSLAEMHHDFLPLLLAAAAEISGRLAKQ
jgi:IclR family transcriptional regulator, pca regulon regulatory protein